MPTPSTSGRRVSASLPVDLGLLVFLVAILLLVTLGGSMLRPYDAPELDPSPLLLPVYAVRSLARLFVAYVIAVTMALAVGHLAARSRPARRIILPTLDVLQSVPIVGFFPAAVAVFIGVFQGSALGVEAAAVFLVFTSMFWNLAFSVYETLITLPEELTLAARQFGLRGPLRWSRMVLPAVTPSLVYSSMLSWSNGWYFLIASEIIAAGKARYTLPGLGSYLAGAVTEGHHGRMLLALVALMIIVVTMHFLLWGPLQVWAERFHLDQMGDRPRTPRVARVLARSRIVQWMTRRVMTPLTQWAFRAWGRLLDVPEGVSRFVPVAAGLLLGWGAVVLASKALVFVAGKPLGPEARAIPWNLLLSLLRVSAGVALAVLIAVPLAFLTFRRARLRQTVIPILQIMASIPGVASFPLVVLLMLRFDLGMNAVSIVLVLMGTFFYVAFNVLSGASAIPKEMHEAASALGLRGRHYLRRVFVPSVLPSLVTGCVTGWGAAWNAIIFSEYVVTGGRVYAVPGIGATLDRATYVTGDLQVVTLSLVSMVALVILVNRLFWDPVYQHVASRYKLEA